jgi:hypothetical protein
MGKPVYKPNPRALAIVEELDRFREFCVDYGYRFNEGDVFNFKSYAWQQYNKFTQGKNAKNMWEEDARRFSGYRRA